MIPEISIQSSQTPKTQGRFVSMAGQSIYDVCLQTYGTIELLAKLVVENNLVSTIAPVEAGKVFTFDKTKIKDTAIFSRNVIDGIIYATMYAPPYGVTDTNIELREDTNLELREDGGLELRQ